MGVSCVCVSVVVTLLACSVDAHRSLCGVVQEQLPSRCSCIDAQLGAVVSCRVLFLENDEVDVIAELLPCDDEAHMDLVVLERDHGFHVTMAGISADEEKRAAIPGLSFLVPGVGNVGAEAVVLMTGNLDDVHLSAGVDACIVVDGLSVCGSALLPELPVWFFHLNFKFAGICDNATAPLDTSSKDAFFV